MPSIDIITTTDRVFKPLPRSSKPFQFAFGPSSEQLEAVTPLEAPAMQRHDSAVELKATATSSGSSTPIVEMEATAFSVGASTPLVDNDGHKLLDPEVLADDDSGPIGKHGEELATDSLAAASSDGQRRYKH
jgi:hypothetical protein